MPRGAELEDQVWNASESQWCDSISPSLSEPERGILGGSGAARGGLLGEPTALAAGNTLAIAPASTRLQIPIEDVPLGARVPTKNPKHWEYDDSLPEPDEATWQVIKFTVTRKDGGVVDAELLRPRSWVEANGLEVGRLLPIDIEELQIEGSATVTAIEAAPAIATGEGSAVTGRFITRQVDEICRIEVLGADGQIDTIEGTTIHPIWSIDRDDWVPLGELQEGEQLLSSPPSPHLGRRIEGDGQTATILAHQVVHRTTPVYNIEIHGEHVYQVGELGILVHNSCEEALKRLPGTVKADIRNLRLDPGGRQFADPQKLLKFRDGWDWAKFNKPIQIEVKNGVRTLVDGVTTVEAALRNGITQLPAIVRYL